MGHKPALADEVVELLVPVLRSGGVVVDATLGRAGHAARILDAAPEATLLGIDRDPQALEESRTILASYGERAQIARDDFQNLSAVLERLGIEKVRGVLLDLGVSSPQLDEADRGFSFRNDGPLDMRMDPNQELTAASIVNDYPERELARIIQRYGEERFARRIARAIVRERPLDSTVRLAEVVVEAIPAATRRTGGHPARRTFQALRIEVNDELEALKTTLPSALESLGVGGRLVVISYHSLEDREVKRFFTEEGRGCTCPPQLAVCVCGAKAKIRILTRKPVRPTPTETEANPRAASARLRAAEKLEAA